jgi:hypothetical protein
VARALRELREPEFPHGEQPVKRVRLVIAPASPTWRVVVTRLSLESDGVQVVTKTLSQWFPGPGTVKIFPTQYLPRTRWNEIDRMLVAGLWSLHAAPFPNPITEDGSAWYLEASGPRGYAEVIQHSPEDGPFRDACQLLLRLSALDVTPNEYISWFTPR